MSIREPKKRQVAQLTRLIINADDLGESESVNREIFGLMEQRLVTSATILANAPAFEHAIAGLEKFPACSVGVHLNLTTHAPLTKDPGLEPLLDNQGCLTRNLFHVPVSTGLIRAACHELTCQVQRVKDTGIRVTHCDSHHHIHTIPWLLPVLKSVIGHFHITRVRSTINLLPPGQRMAALRGFRKGVFRLVMRYLADARCPEGLGDFRDFYAALQSGEVPRFKCIELMVHPGATTARYRDEITLLRSDWGSLLPADVELTTYETI